MKNKLIAYIIALPIAVAGLSLSFGQPAQAQFEFLEGIVNQFTGAGVQNVRIIGDASEASLTTAIKTTLSALTGERTANALEQLLLKEQVLDPAAWGVAKKLQQQLTGELLKWLGGQQPGQNGQVPFIQNYSDYYQGVADKVAGGYIFVDKAGSASGQCATYDPEREHRVLTALNNSYLSDRQKSQYGGSLQCSDGEDTGYKNATDKLLGNFLECRDEACAYFAGRKEQADRTEVAIQIARDTASMSGGMTSTRVCPTVTGSDGVEREHCLLVNPPSLANEMVKFNLVELPGLQLLNMDEFNEIASNLMNNLANQALQGLTGVLGLSGNPNYGQNVFGDDGNLSYADALARDDVSRYQTGGINAVKDSLANELRYYAIQLQILGDIGGLENKLADNEEEFGSCFDMELTDRLKEIKAKAATDSNTSSTTIAILTVLDKQYDQATDAAARNTVLVTYAEYKNQGFFHTNYQIQDLQISFINLEFARLVDQFKYDMAVARQECGGDFDYDGILNEENDDEDED